MLLRSKEMAYLEEFLPVLRNGGKIRRKPWTNGNYIYLTASTIKCFYGFNTSITREDIVSNDWGICSINDDPYYHGNC